MNIIPISSAASYVDNTSDHKGITHLRMPVAPLAVCRLRFSPDNKKPSALLPTEAARAIEEYPDLQSVELDGPGDPLLSLDLVAETVTLIKKQHPQLQLSITTLGFDGVQHAEMLAKAGVDGVNLLVDSLEPETITQLFSWIRPGRKTIPLQTIAPQLPDEQIKTVEALSKQGIAVNIRTTVYPGLNAHQIGPMAEALLPLGAKSMELFPFLPGPEQENVPQAPTKMQMELIGKLVSALLPTSVHQVEENTSGCCTTAEPENSTMDGLPKPQKDRPNVAVASTSGMDVDLHLGQAKTLLIYGPREDGLHCLLETRQTPQAGGGENRWEQLADTLHDCFALLAASAGQKPRDVLGTHGIRVFVTEENIEGTVDVLYGGGKKKKCKK